MGLEIFKKKGLLTKIKFSFCFLVWIVNVMSAILSELFEPIHGALYM